jgi:hypothetical protein
MGVLDDAIREHLDLKRRHGVAEEELRRQEEEALGPARREVAPEEAGEDGAAVEAEAAAAEPAPAEPAPADVGEPTEEHAVEELEFGDEPPAEPELSESLPASAVRSDVADETLDPEAPPEPDFDEEERLDDDEVEEDDLDEEGDLDDEDQPAEDADVLEDTPDFLQETPEHDRLWFEQKPPRDFDFD